MKKQAAVVSKTPQTPQTSQVKPVRGRPRKKVVIENAVSCDDWEVKPIKLPEEMTNMAQYGKSIEAFGKAMQNENVKIVDIVRLATEAGFNVSFQINENDCRTH